jgi:hypothetical protein
LTFLENPTTVAILFNEVNLLPVPFLAFEAHRHPLPASNFQSRDGFHRFASPQLAALPGGIVDAQPLRFAGGRDGTHCDRSGHCGHDA